MVLPHLFFYSELHQSQSWPCLAPGILFSPLTRATLAAPFRRSLLTDIFQGPFLQFLLQEDLHPSSRHKAQPDLGPRAGSNNRALSSPWEAGLGDLAVGESL